MVELGDKPRWAPSSRSHSPTPMRDMMRLNYAPISSPVVDVAQRHGEKIQSPCVMWVN